MSSTQLWMTTVFDDDQQAARYAECYEALQACEHERYGALNKALRIKPMLSDAEAVFIESINRFGAGVEIRLSAPAGIKVQNAHFKDIAALGCRLVIVDSADDQDGSNAFAVYIEGRKAAKKAVLDALPELAPELQLLLAARLAPRKVDAIIRQLGGHDAMVLGRPLVFSLTRLLPEADPLLLAVLDKADLNQRDPVTGQTLLQGFFAPKGANRAMVNAILQVGFDPSCHQDARLLIAAAAAGDYHAVMALLRSGRIDPNETDAAGKNCLHYICSAPLPEQEDCVREAIAHGVDVNKVSEEGSPLWLAIKYSPRVVPLLVAAQARSEAGIKSYPGNPAADLKVAIEHDDEATFRRLAEQCDDEAELYEACVLAARHLRDHFLQALHSRTDHRPHLASRVDNERLFNCIWKSVPDAEKAAAVSWLLLKAGMPAGEPLADLDFSPFILHKPEEALDFIGAIAAAGGQVADAVVSFNRYHADMFARKVPALADYLAALMKWDLNVSRLLGLVQDEHAREALEIRSAQLGHLHEGIRKLIYRYFVTDNAGLLDILRNSRLHLSAIQQEIWLYLLYAPGYGAWQHFDPPAEFLAPLVEAGLDINFPVQVFMQGRVSPLRLAKDYNHKKTVAFLEKAGAREQLA